MILLHEILGKYLGPFHLGRRLIGAKNGNAFFLAYIGNAFCQRYFGTYNDHVYAFFYGKIGNAVQFFHPDGHTFCYRSYGIAARQGIQFVYARTLGQFPSQGMFTATAANNGYVHQSAAPFSTCSDR